MRWGILATGNIAGKFASTILAMENEGEILAAVGSRRLQSAETFAQKYHISKAYGSYEELAQDPDVEAVYVATPNSMHYENCLLCLSHGKHVLCEKPFTINVQQAQELYDMASQKGLFLMEALWTWFLPLYGKLRNLMKEGTLGEIRQITCQYGFVAAGARRERKFDSSLGGGALLDIGIYNLAFLYLLKQEMPKTFTSQVRMSEYGTDAYSKLLFDYTDGSVAESVQTIGEELERNATVIGTKGTVFLKDFQHAQSMTVRLENQEETVLEYPEDINGFEYQIREVTRCVRAGKTASDCYTPEDSMAIGKLLYDIRKSWGMHFTGEED